jgi:hypothetical protein
MVGAAATAKIFWLFRVFRGWEQGVPRPSAGLKAAPLRCASLRDGPDGPASTPVPARGIGAVKGATPASLPGEAMEMVDG